MLSLEDCIGLCGLTEEEVRAIAAHEIAWGNREREFALKRVLRNFILQHPACDARHHCALHLPERRLI